MPPALELTLWGEVWDGAGWAREESSCCCCSWLWHGEGREALKARAAVGWIQFPFRGAALIQIESFRKPYLVCRLHFVHPWFRRMVACNKIHSSDPIFFFGCI